jgi:hypothetical protein
MTRMSVVVLVASVALAAGLGSGSAAAAGSKKLVEGTVYDATCVAVCQPECPPPPHCGPVPATQSRSAAICARAAIVCPLYRATADICLPSSNCAGYPVYTGEGSLINVRRMGSATVIARLPVVEGHFTIRLAPGQYIFHPYMAEEQCWSAEPWRVQVTARDHSPIPTTLGATNNCVVHADG